MQGMLSWPMWMVLLCVTSYCLAVAIYRLTIHPLAKYPGPLLGRITDWYSVYQAASGDRHLNFLRLHEKYGPLVRFGPNRLSSNTADGLKQIYGTKCNTRKASYYATFAHVFKGDSSNTIIDPVKHGRKKRVLTQALSEKSIAAMEEHVLNNVRRFWGVVGSDGGGEREEGRLEQPERYDEVGGVFDV
ncbi:hypothetical protein ABVK25_011077 [Lepraria finkii]|uniref:Uncharacterized protein n=1 Tax=Lepraria finkii TaxID=1340010 RepID=A0ABR4ARD9_9LECA